MFSKEDTHTHTYIYIHGLYQLTKYLHICMHGYILRYKLLPCIYTFDNGVMLTYIHVTLFG